MQKIILPLSGLHCRSCEILVKESLEAVAGVKGAKVSCVHQEAVISADKEIDREKLEAAVVNAGYQVGRAGNNTWLSRDWRDYRNFLVGIAAVGAIYAVLQILGWSNISPNTGDGGVIIALLVGIVAGLSTCMAIVGGLVLGLSARHAEVHPEATRLQKFRPHLYFNLGRVAGFGILGGFIGWLGSFLQLSNNLLGLMTIVVGLVMIFLGLKLIEIFPKLRNHSLSLPSGLAAALGLGKEAKEYSRGGSIVLGALTFFLPCGFTQAMQVYAISSGSFISGAMIMSLFALGTAPGLLSIGGLAAVVKGRTARMFFAFAGVAVIVMGCFNLINGKNLIFFGATTDSNGQNTQAVQEVRMTQKSSGYQPNVFTIQAGRPVRWIITSEDQFSCASSIVMPQYGISKSLRQGENIIEFTPRDKGEIRFSCSMGMYTGKFIVTDGSPPTVKGAVENSNGGATCALGGGCSGCSGFRRPSQTVAPVSAVESTADGKVQLLNTSYTLNGDISPNIFNVKKGVPVRLEINVKESGQGCMSTIMIPGLYQIPEVLQAGQKIIMEFTPEKAGSYPITCAMGVERGKIIVE